MIKDPRCYTEEYPKSNILIKLALDVLKSERDFNDLKEQIAKLLGNNNDALVNVALNLSPSFAVSNMIWRALNAAINDIPNLCAHIFAIPLVLVAGSTTSARLVANVADGVLNDYFWQNKIFNPGADCFISGKLIDPRALAKIKPSQLYHWQRELQQAKLWLPMEIEGTPIQVLNEGVFLRFLIGITITQGDLGVNQEAYRSSSMGLMKLINQALQHETVTLFVIPFHPVSLSEAYLVGDNKRTEIAITVAISNVVRKLREKKLRAVAILQSDGAALKISICSANDSSIQETSLWHLTKFENYQEHITTITNLLHDMQLEYSYVN